MRKSGTVGRRRQLNFESVRVVKIDPIADHAGRQAGLLQFLLGRPHIIIVDRVTVMIHARRLAPEQRQKPIIERKETTVVTPITRDAQPEMADIEVSRARYIRHSQCEMIQANSLEQARRVWFRSLCGLRCAGPCHEKSQAGDTLTPGNPAVAELIDELLNLGIHKIGELHQ